MTVKQIQQEAEKAAVPYELAVQIRELLDKAKATYGATRWDDDDVEARVLDLVAGE